MKTFQFTRMMVITASVTLVLSIVAGTHAAIIYDEAVNGDLAGDESAPTPIGSLIEGVNTFRGTHIFPDGQSQGDTFEVDLPADLSITSISLDISNFLEAPGTLARARVFSIPPFTIYGAQTFTGDTATSFDSALPLPTLDSYAFALKYQTAESPNGYDWEWTITTVPEPSTLATVALGGLALLRRRRR